MHTAVTSIFVLDRPCDQYSIVLWCTQPSHQYLFWTDRVFSSVLYSDVHSYRIQYLFWTDRVFSWALRSDAHSHRIQYLFWTDRVFSTALCSDVHSHRINICSGQTVCSVQYCTLMYTSIAYNICSGQTVCSVEHCALIHTAIILIFVLDRPCAQFSTVLWCTQPSQQYLFWTDRVLNSALCTDVHSHHINICSG